MTLFIESLTSSMEILRMPQSWACDGSEKDPDVATCRSKRHSRQIKQRLRPLLAEAVVAAVREARYFYTS